MKEMFKMIKEYYTEDKKGFYTTVAFLLSLEIAYFILLFVFRN